ncbi:MAG: TetR family transcriptional regulator [Deltaproteobacteria bacterium]|nr:TetR family transcriptional regulator [Deltaproteobacteria bacterium]
MLISERAQYGLRERNRADKEVRILAAGRELFSRDGFEATTTRAIAQRAGIGTGTLFLYFPEKRDLLLRLFKDDIAPVHRAAVASLESDLPLLDAGLRVFRSLYDYYARDPRLSRVFLSELPFRDPTRAASLALFTLDFLQAIARLVEVARERGEIARDCEPLAVARTMFRLYYAVLIEWISGVLPSPAAAEHELRASLEQLVRGIAHDTETTP